MSQFPKQIFSVEGSSTGHYTVFGIIGSRTYHNTKQMEAVKKYVRECNGERIKRTSSVRSHRRMMIKTKRNDGLQLVS